VERTVPLVIALASALAAGCGPAGERRASDAGGAGSAPPPAAEVRDPEGATVGRRVELVGSARGMGAPGGEVAYRWRQRSGPPVALEGARSARARFTPIYSGRYVFSLVIELPRRGAPAPGRVSEPAFVAVEVRDLDAEPVAPAERRVSIEARGADLTRLVEDFPDATGLVLRVSPRSLRPERFGEVRTELVVADAPALLAVEFAARAARMRYRFDSPGSVWLARDYAWMDDLPREASVYAMDRVTRDAERARAVVALMRDLVRPCLTPDSNCTFAYDEERRTVTAVLPRRAHARCLSLLRLLGTPAGRIPEPPPEGRALRAVRAKLAAEVAGDGRARPVREALWDLAARAGVPIGFDPPPREAEVALPAGPLALGEALGRIERAAGYRGHVVVRGGGLWVHASEDAPLATAEFVWESATVETYPLAELRARGYEGARVERLVRARVHPVAWQDADGAIRYLPGFERLAVCHVPAVQHAVARFLRRLAAAPASKEAMEKEKRPPPAR